MTFHPSRDEFRARVARGENVIPVFCEKLADTQTPVAVLARMAAAHPRHFLLESVVGGEKWAAHSFAGGAPHAVVRIEAGAVEVRWRDGRVERHEGADPTVALRALLGRFRAAADVAGLPRFWGGLVGWLGYDLVRAFERLPARAPDTLELGLGLGLPDGLLCLSDEMVVFDNPRQTMKLLAVAHCDGSADADAAYDAARARVESMAARLREPLRLAELDTAAPVPNTWPRSSFTREGFCDAVRRAREYIAAGDVVQVVLSQRFELPQGGIDTLALYRALRVINPSPYLYYLGAPELTVAGASPEVMVRLDGETVEVRPIAGTRRRGRTPDEDVALAAELRADPKERAEHVMLVDLGRNDVGRVSVPGSVRVPERMTVERYSHVMHLVSSVVGRLAPGLDALDVLRATFPAGTLSGAPKVRAMEIIEELEPCRRGVYGGAVGYVSYSGHMDLAIAIRTFVAAGGTLYGQAGAGVVYDSDPEREYQETIDKARALLAAVAMARSAR
ncbi:MAG: anthranilate synthase component I family protein [Myxococcota bacterium]